MDNKILEFITSHNVSSVTTMLPDDSPHAAALHYSSKVEPLEFYFSTENTSKKCQGLLSGQSGKASVVIGFSEEEWITLQMDGVIRTVTKPDELKRVQEIHYAKHPGSAKI